MTQFERPLPILGEATHKVEQQRQRFWPECWRQLRLDRTQSLPKRFHSVQETTHWPSDIVESTFVGDFFRKLEHEPEVGWCLLQPTGNCVT